MSADVSFRLATEADTPYLVTTFAKSFIGASAYASLTPATERGDMLRPFLAEWIAEVAHEPEDASTILGWVCYSPLQTAVAWLFVRPAFRGCGLGTLLLKRALPAPVVTSPFAPTRAELLAWLRKRGVADVRFRPWMTP